MGVDRREPFADGWSLTAVKRRAYLTGLGVGLVAIPAIYAARAARDPVLLWTYPFLFALLLVIFVGLLTRRITEAGAERAVTVFVPMFWLGRLATSLHGIGNPAVAQRELVESVQPGLTIVLVILHLANDTRRALRLSAVLLGAYVAIVVSGFVVGAPVDLVTSMRSATFMIATLAMVHAMARARDRMVERERAAARYAELATTDALTGAANRRRAEQVLAERLADAQRYGRAVSVVLFDLDHFKRLNDTQGHAAGDRALVEVKRRIGGDLRMNDLLARWGGEEFLVVLPETSVGRATALADRWRSTIAAIAEPVITASFGVAQYRPGDTPSALVRRADAALYAAKRGGRDRVEVGV